MSHTDVFINKSGRTYLVKDKQNGVPIQLGVIMPNEIFGANDPNSYDLVPGDYGPCCVFRNSLGQRVIGSGDVCPYISIGNVIPDGLFTSISRYPYSRVVINGTTYKTLKARRNTTIYRPGGSVWGTVAANCQIALAWAGYDMSFSGDTNMDYIAVAYVQSTSGNWVQATGDGRTYCFAPIGLNYGSGASSINFIGTL